MREILLNMALRDLTQFCLDQGIPPHGHVEKIGRGFKYSLISSTTGKPVATVTFHKSQVPTHSIHPR